MGLFNKLNQRITTQQIKETAVESIDESLVNDVIFGEIIGECSDLLSLSEADDASITDQKIDALNLQKTQLQRQGQKRIQAAQEKLQKEKANADRKEQQIDDRIAALKAAGSASVRTSTGINA